MVIFINGPSGASSGSGVISIGAYNSQAPNANGGAIVATTLYFQSATAAVPGMVNTGGQTFAGIKTFNSAPNLNSLTASLPLKLDAGKNIISALIDLTTDVTAVLPEANGGTNQSTYTKGDVLYSSAANTLSKLPIGTLGQVLEVSAGGIPSWAGTTAGVTTVGAYDSQAAVLDGLQIIGTTIYAQSADVTNPGMVNTGVQSFAGAKTFTGNISAANLSGTNTGDQTITLTGDVTGSGTGSFAATISALAVTNAKIANATIDLTTKVTGVLPEANGGTHQSTYTKGDLLYASAANTLSKLGIGSTGQLLNVDVTGIPAWVGSAVSVNTVGAIDSQSPSADGATIVGTSIFFQSASATDVGMVNTTVQSFAGDKTFVGNIIAANLSGTNSGDITLAAVGTVPNANAASLTGQVLNLQPADGTNPGVLTAGAQTIGGAKTFTGAIVASNLSGTNTGDQTITLTGDVTGSGTGSFAATIAALAVTNAKIANGTIDLTTKVTGVLPEVNGGTHQSTYTTGDLLYASAANTLSKLPVGAANTVLTISAGVPSWQAPASAGVTTLAAVGATPNSNAATISGNTLNLEYFNATNPGVVSASGGAGTKFLRDDNTWQTPSGFSEGLYSFLTTSISGYSLGSAILWDTSVYLSGFTYNAGNGRFTTPTTGTYLVSVGITINNLNSTAIVSGDTIFGCKVNNLTAGADVIADQSQTFFNGQALLGVTAPGTISMVGSVQMQLSAGDVFQIETNTYTGSITSSTARALGGNDLTFVQIQRIR